MYRVGHDLYVGQSTLKKLTIIDILNDGWVTIFDHTKKSVQTISVEGEEIYLHLTNGIDQPETQDTPKRFMLEADESKPSSVISEGEKVKFKTTFFEAELEVIGYVVKNFWGNYYLITEQGVSVPNRYWKVGHNLVEKY